MLKNDTRNKVLIVDDSNANIQVLMEVLRHEYAVVVATDGEKAIRMAHLHPHPDIILLDVNMPGKSGYEVCAELKKTPSTKDIPIIFITTLSRHEEEKYGLDLGAVDYIIKPFCPDLVKARVRNHLDLKLHRDHLEELVDDRTRELRLAQDAAIYGLGILAEYRDPETGQHLKRTQQYVQLLTEHLQNHPRFRDYFDQYGVHTLYVSTPIHDIGKVGVPDHILHKPGPLTIDEFEQMKQHTTYGRDTVLNIEKLMNHASYAAFLQCAKDITYTHHERWDGTGYHGMKGEEIPVPGRLMALADIYDALVSKRVYKPAFSHEQAVAIITRGDGRTQPGHFDPDVLQAFVEQQEGFRRISAEYQD